MWDSAQSLGLSRVLKATAVVTLFAAQWVALPRPLAASEAGERLAIVDRSIEHHGGETYRSIAAELDVCSKSGCFHVATNASEDRFDYTVSGKVSGALREVRSSGGELSLRLDGQPTPITEDRRQSYRDWAMARIYFCFLPYRLNDPGVSKEDLGLTSWEGHQLHRVKVTFAPGSSTDASDEYMYWFDAGSGRLEYFAYTYNDNGGGLRFRRAVRHRRLGGILFFDQENLGVEGPDLTVDAIDAAYVRDTLRLISTVRLENIEVRTSR